MAQEPPQYTSDGPLTSVTALFHDTNPGFDAGCLNTYYSASPWPTAHQSAGAGLLGHGAAGPSGGETVDVLEPSSPQENRTTLQRLFEGGFEGTYAPFIPGSKQLQKAQKLQERAKQKERISSELLDGAQNPKATAHLFERKLRALQKQDLFDPSICTTDGLNLLGVAVVSKNIEAMRSIYYAGFWGVLRGHRVSNESPNRDLRNKDAREIAYGVVKSRKVLMELDRLDDLENAILPLHKACRKGDVNEVVALVGNISVSDFHKQDKEGNTALHYACRSGDVDTVISLVRAGATLRTVNNDDQNVLHIAIRHTHYRLLKALLKMKKIRATDKDSAGKSPLIYTAETGHITPLRMLLAYGVEEEMDILGTAATNGHLPYLKHVIEFKQENNIKLKLKMKMNVNYQDRRSKTVLHHACAGGHIEVIKYLLDKLQNVSGTLQKVNHGGQNILHICCENLPDGSEVPQFLLEQCKRFNIEKKVVNQQDFYTGTSACVLVSGKDHGRPAYHYVEAKRHLVSIFESKVRSGLVDVANYGQVVKSGWGDNPTRSVIEEIENFFLNRVQPGQPRAQDACPLHVAVFKEKYNQAKLLLRFGANVNAQDAFGLSPLHYSAMRGNLKMLKLLENHGAKADLRDKDGRMAFDVARKNDHSNIVHYLQGQEHLSKFEEFARLLEKKLELFMPSTLEKLRSSGKDVRKHLVDACVFVVRDVQIDINMMLMDLGTSPIMEETST